MATEPLVLTADHGPVRVLTMNRPAARNALSRDLIRTLYAALTGADADESVRAVVLTGTDPAFCAGVDLKEAQRDGMAYFEEFQSQSCITAVAGISPRRAIGCGSPQPFPRSSSNACGGSIMCMLPS